MIQWWIYDLLDPRTGATRYVGKTIHQDKRLREHMRHSVHAKGHLGNWLRVLVGLGLKPEIVFVESGFGDGWAEAERARIRDLRASGVNLVNDAEGGQGPHGVVRSAEFRAKLSEAARNSPKAAAHRARLADARRGTTASEETRRRLSVAHKGRVVGAETRMKLSLAGKGRTHTSEAKAKIAATAATSPKAAAHRAALADKRRGSKMSKETRRRMSEAHTGVPKPMSPEGRANLVEANRRRAGFKHTEETKAKMSAAHLARRNGITP